jgi:hypothetical protein
MVNFWIKDGWKPIGGVSIDGEVYVQAMTRESQEVSIEVGPVDVLTGEYTDALAEAINSQNPYQVDTRLVVKKSGEFTELEELGLGDMITIEKYARDVRLYDCYLHKQDRNTPITFEELEEYFQVV